MMRVSPGSSLLWNCVQQSNFEAFFFRTLSLNLFLLLRRSQGKKSFSGQPAIWLYVSSGKHHHWATYRWILHLPLPTFKSLLQKISSALWGKNCGSVVRAEVACRRCIEVGENELCFPFSSSLKLEQAPFLCCFREVTLWQSSDGQLTAMSVCSSQLESKGEGRKTAWAGNYNCFVCQDWSETLKATNNKAKFAVEVGMLRTLPACIPWTSSWEEIFQRKC